MADLTNDEKIAIGVGAGIGGLILIGLICLLLWVYFTKEDDKRKAHKYDYGVRYSDDRRYPPYDDDRHYDGPYEPSRPYPIDDRKYRPRRELPEPYLVPRDPYPVPRDPYPLLRPSQEELDRKYYPPWDGRYRKDPVVVPIAEPEYIRNAEVARPEVPETLYVQYQDDQAIMEDNNYRRRSQQYPLRRSGSLRDLRDTRQPYGRSQRRPKYIGDWERPVDRMDEFNKGAYHAGRDPFLWQ